MALNQLIALGGTQNKSPYQRHMEAKAQSQKEQMNALAMAAQKQNIASSGQTMDIQREKQNAANIEAYMKSTAPILRTVLSAPDPSAAYTQVLPQIQQVAQKLNMPAPQPVLDINGASALVQKFAPFEPNETRDVPVKDKQGRYFNAKLELDPVTGQWKELGRRPVWEQTEALPEGYSVPKKVEAKLKEKLIDGVTLQNQMFDLADIIKDSPDMAQTWVADVGAAGLEGLARTFGIDYGDDINKFLSKKENIRALSRKMQDNYRKIITGAQANKYELKRIEQQMPNENDSKRKMLDKIKILTEIQDIANVRANLALKNGLKFIGRNKDNELVYRDKSGKRVTIDDYPALSDIRPRDETIQNIFNQVVKADPQIDDVEATRRALRKVAEMGYNMRGLSGY